MNLRNIIIGACSILFFMIGVDKFVSFLEPPCSLSDSIPNMVWKIFGVLQIVAGFLIWIPKYTKYVAGFFLVFMSVFTIVHIMNGTYDIGGSVSMAVLLGFVYWDPDFLRCKQ